MFAGGMTPEQQAKMQQEMLSNPDTLKVRPPVPCLRVQINLLGSLHSLLREMEKCWGCLAAPDDNTPPPLAASPASQMVQNMMQSMDPKTMAALSKQAGMELSEEQAAKVRGASFCPVGVATPPPSDHETMRWG